MWHRGSARRFRCRTVTSSRSSTCAGRISPTAICTRRRCPSLTVCMRHSSSMSSTSINFFRLTGSPPMTPSSICDAGKSPASGTENPANATSCSQLPPMYDSRPCVVRLVAWNGGCPSTRTWCSGIMCLPARILSSVVLPAPFAPTSSMRLPCRSSRFTWSSTGGPAPVALA